MNEFNIKNSSKKYNFERTKNNLKKKRKFLILLSIIIISIIITAIICIYYYLHIKKKNNVGDKIYDEKNILNIYNNKTWKQRNNTSINDIKNGNIFTREKNITNENFDVFMYSIESIKYEITPTSYVYGDFKYKKVKGYYVETENGFPVYIISGGDSYNIKINEVKIEGNNVVIYIKDKYVFSKRVLPRYGFTKIKFDRKPDKITILNYEGKYYLPA